MFHEPDCEKLLKKNCQNHHLGLPASNCAFPSILYTKSTSSMKTNQNWNDFAVCSIKFEGGSKRNGWKCRRQDNVRNGVLNGVDIKRKLPIRPAPTSESQVSRRRCCPYASSNFLANKKHNCPARNHDTAVSYIDVHNQTIMIHFPSHETVYWLFPDRWLKFGNNDLLRTKKIERMWRSQSLHTHTHTKEPDVFTSTYQPLKRISKNTIYSLMLIFSRMFDVFTSFHLAGIGKASMYLFRF